MPLIGLCLEIKSALLAVTLDVAQDYLGSFFSEKLLKKLSVNVVFIRALTKVFNIHALLKKGVLNYLA